MNRAEQVMQRVTLWVSRNWWPFLAAFLVGRLAARVMGLVMPPIESFWVAATIGLFVQGVVFGYVYCAMKDTPTKWSLCLSAPVVLGVVTFPVLYLGVVGAFDPRWMMIGLPLSVIALAILAAILVPEPRPKDPEEVSG